LTGAGYKHLFQRALAAAPERLHFASNTHHLWPDASFVGHLAAWEDAARLADRKWDRVMGEIWPAAQGEVAAELRLPDPATVAFAPNTHELLVRLVSAHPAPRPLRVLTSDGEFHSFRRQSARWREAGEMQLDIVPVAGADFGDRFVERAQRGEHDLIFVSQVMFESGQVLGRLDTLAALARPEGPWVVIDGYHAFMAIDVDLAAVADRLFYLAGGYKYAMAGEGAAFLHAPADFGPRPAVTGWYAAFADLAAPPGQIGYAADAGRFLGATFDPSGLYRFLAVRQMLAEEGLTTARISAHVTKLQRDLIDRLRGSAPGGCTLLNPPASAHARFLALRTPKAAAWQERLAADDVIVDHRGDVLRIGLALYHDQRDVGRLAEAVRRLH
jgi:selenocysteine lyase/cysteine desulfurase